jgi:c-di-GMP-binding flagellar brake protein YcgR
MFGQTISKWRRLLGGQPASGQGIGQAIEEERRVWVRHAADLETTYQPADGPDGNRLAARVRNVSQGGINLLVSSPFEPGEMLSVELPSSSEGSTNTVLACVVHVTPHGDDEWVLGCTFARELSDDDLQGFGARRVKQPPPDQRTWMRFPANIKASYQLITTAQTMLLPAQVLNISVTGIGLLANEPVTAGTLLNVEMHGATGPGVRTILACVVHVTARGEGEWALGCNFIRSLSEEDLQALL